MLSVMKIAAQLLMQEIRPMTHEQVHTMHALTRT
jgi:hypothetical protein